MEWLSQVSYLGAFLVGFFGGVHCLGMCGGIVTALSFNRPNTPTSSPSNANSSHLSVLIGYNLGRLLSYTVAGALVGGLGAMSVFGLDALTLQDVQSTRSVLTVIAAFFMMALGLYLAGIWRGIAKLERVGHRLWKYIEPASRRFIPATGFRSALPLGILWGWLPCGLVYTVLIWSLSAGSSLEGALLMLSFGIGTLPNLMAMGLVADKLSRWVRQAWIRYLAGGLVTALGLMMLVGVWL